MSTYLYLECHAHQPPITSDGEVGQHLYDLPAIREYIKHRAALAEVLYLDGVNMTSYASAAASFLKQHPNCPLRIGDEYGETHAVDIEEEA